MGIIYCVLPPKHSPRSHRKRQPPKSEAAASSFTRGSRALVEDSLLVSAPIDTDSRQGGLGRSANLDLLRTHIAGVDEAATQDVSRLPCRFQVYLGRYRIDGSAVGLASLQRPLVDRSVLLARVIDDAPSLGQFTNTDETWNRQSSEQPDKGYHNHDFNKGERCPIIANPTNHLTLTFLVWCSYRNIYEQQA